MKKYNIWQLYVMYIVTVLAMCVGIFNNCGAWSIPMIVLFVFGLGIILYWYVTDSDEEES